MSTTYAALPKKKKNDGGCMLSDLCSGLCRKEMGVSDSIFCI